MRLFKPDRSPKPHPPTEYEHRPIRDLKVAPHANPVAPTPEQVTYARKHGLNVPVMVKPDGTIIDGRLNFLAAKQAGLTDVPVIVYHGK